MVIGIGINGWPSGRPLRNRLTAGGASVSAGEVFAALSVKMPGRLAQWNRSNGFATIRADWLARAAGVGENIRVGLADRELAGRFEGLDDSGALVLVVPDGSKVVVAAGDVISFEGSQ